MKQDDGRVPMVARRCRHDQTTARLPGPWTARRLPRPFRWSFRGSGLARGFSSLSRRASAPGRAQQDVDRPGEHRAGGRGPAKGSAEPVMVLVRVRAGPGGDRSATSRTLARRSRHRREREGGPGHRRARGPQEVGQENRPRGQVVAGQHRQDRQRRRVGELLVSRRGSILPSAGRALHPGSPLRRRQERPEVPHEAEDSAPVGGAFGRDGVPFRAVVADSFYGEDRGFKCSLGESELATCWRSRSRIAGGTWWAP